MSSSRKRIKPQPKTLQQLRSVNEAFKLVYGKTPQAAIEEFIQNTLNEADQKRKLLTE